MKCPYCGAFNTRVTDSRRQDGGFAIKRRRFCDNCGKRFTTFERVDTIKLSVVKSDGTRENFDKNKLINGIIKSCNKRNVELADIERLVDTIESQIGASEKKEIQSKDIGEMVMNGLKTIDDVAYLRFASVYKQFKDIYAFKDELERIIKEKENQAAP